MKKIHLLNADGKTHCGINFKLKNVEYLLTLSRQTTTCKKCLELTNNEQYD